MKKTLTLFISFFSFACMLSAQSEPAKNKVQKHELGLNVTNLLTDLLGNNNRTDAGDYLISYKKLKDKSAFRVGLGINVSVKNDNINTFNTTLNNNNFQLRMGKEWRQDIAPRFQFYYGIDGIVGSKLEESSAAATSTIITQSSKTFSFGGGPILGFQFALYDKLLLGTEGAFYAAYSKNSVSFNNVNIGSVGFPQQIPTRSSSGFDVQTRLPKFLFLILKF